MLNHIVIQGRLGSDPELRKTQAGKSVASVNLAVQRDGKDAETDWISIVAWERTADFLVNYFSKGDTCIVSGRLQIRSYMDRNQQKRTAAEVVADRIYFPGSKSEMRDTEPLRVDPQAFEFVDDDGPLPF